MKNILIVGATLPQTLADPDGSNPKTTLGGQAPAMAQTMMQGNQLRVTLLTALQRDELGKATIRLLEQSGLLYRAVDCDIPTQHRVMRRRHGAEPHPEPIEYPTITRSLMFTPLSQTAPDYDYVVADCNLDNEILFELARMAQKLVLIGTSEQRCMRILSTNPWPKAAVCINRREAQALLEFSETRSEQQLKDLLIADQLLITKDAQGWTLYNHHGRSDSPPTYAPGHQNYDGAGPAALGALVQAMSKGVSDPTDEINSAIAARLEQNPR